MQPISTKLVIKAFVILLNTLIFGLLLGLITSSEALIIWSRDRDIIEWILLPLVFLLLVSYSLINNAIIEIAPKNIMIVYIVSLAIFLCLSFLIFWLYALVVIVFLFIYVLIFYIINPEIKKVFLADLLTFILVFGMIVLFELIIKTEDNLVYYYSFAFAYFGIFHFILILLNIRTLSLFEGNKSAK